MTEPTAYPTVDAQASFPTIEHRVLDRWATDGTFVASVEQRPAGTKGDNEYVFYDGPPFANGLPHYGHLLTGYVKDVVPRYQTMRGKRVERVFGWDCHGLPIEYKVSQELRKAERAAGLQPAEEAKTGTPTHEPAGASAEATPRQLQTGGTLDAATIRKACDAYARKYIDLQRTQFKRLGVLGDWENPYLTLNKIGRAHV